MDIRDASSLLSIVIPAHNEGAVIARCLSSLESTSSSIGEVIVVCNGCTDATVTIAKTFANRLPQLTVVETAVASKSNALNLGDQQARLFPRVYLDADIITSAADLQRAAAVLATGSPEEAEQGAGIFYCSAPTLRVDRTRASPVVKAFYAIWLKLPYFRDRSMVGSGVFVLSRAGRARFDSFPAIIADDGFVRTRFSRAERCTVEGAEFVVQAPADVHSLIKIKTRARLGNLELESLFPGSAIGGDNTPGALLQLLVRRPWLLPAAVVYVLVQRRTRATARARLASNALSGWDRDESSRVAVAAGTDSETARQSARLKVLLISSSGGHWKQLLRLRPAFVGETLLFACTESSYSSLVAGQTFFAVPESSLSSKATLLRQALAVFALLLRTRPDVVVTTGAAPGFFALFFASRVIGPVLRLFRGRSIKTVWVDSIANVDELSVSGRQAAPFADMHLTQWPHLANCMAPGKPAFSGAVL